MECRAVASYVRAPGIAICPLHWASACIYRDFSACPWFRALSRTYLPLPLGRSSIDRDPKPLRRAAHLFGDHFLNQFLSPTETSFIQATHRPFQDDRDDDFRIPGRVR